MKAHRNILPAVFYCVAFYALVIFCLVSCSTSEEDPTPATNEVNITSTDPKSPANLVFYESAATNDRVFITYNYQIAHSDGARIWVQPYTNGSKTPGFLYSKSPVYSGSGSKTAIISVEKGGNDDMHVDQLRIIVTDPDQNVDLLERFVDVDFTFSD